MNKAEINAAIEAANRVFRFEQKGQSELLPCPPLEARQEGSSIPSVPSNPDYRIHTVQARIVKEDVVSEVSNAEPCFHCNGKGQCRCAVCGAQDAIGRYVAGQCGSCKGTGHIAFSEDLRCQ